MGERAQASRAHRRYAWDGCRGVLHDRWRGASGAKTRRGDADYRTDACDPERRKVAAGCYSGTDDADLEERNWIVARNLRTRNFARNSRFLHSASLPFRKEKLRSR